MNDEYTKENKLKDYSEKDLNILLQYDVFQGGVEDSLMKPDVDGDWVSWSFTHELMGKSPDEPGAGWAVRVFVVPGTPEKDVVRALLKVLTTINQYGLETEERMKGYVEKAVKLTEKEERTSRVTLTKPDENDEQEGVK